MKSNEEANRSSHPILIHAMTIVCQQRDEEKKRAKQRTSNGRDTYDNTSILYELYLIKRTYVYATAPRKKRRKSIISLCYYYHD